jgi:tRNA pseudouridine55 synthase
MIEKGTPYNGLLLIHKPKDLTSHDVVARVRRALNQKSVGHTGTLDPMATGLMVLVLGEATKLSDFLTFSDKVYRVKAKLGVRTDSFDATGKVLSQVKVDLGQEQIRAAALSLQGEFDWPIPIFSAAKVDGKKLYEYAREQKPIALPIKRMEFSEVSIESIEPDAISATLRCSKGSFIRSWCAELGEKLGSGGHMEALERLHVGPYSLSQAVTLEDLDRDPKTAERAFVSMSAALPEHRSVRVPTKEQRLLMNGQIPRDLANRLIVEQKEALRRQEIIPIKVLGPEGELISILVAQPGQGLKIRRVFRLDPSRTTQ